MRFPPFPRFPVLPPWRGLPLVAVCALYLFAGLTGHDPWKNDDATHFGVAWDIVQHGHWWLPQFMGMPWLDTPPLYYWIAAACGHLFGGLLPLHDAIRLASGLCGALFLTLLAFASRLLHKTRAPAGEEVQQQEIRRLAGNAAPLIAIGCLGLLLPIHDTQPLIALLAASAVAYGGYALLPLRPLAGGVLAGLGMGLGFLAGGLVALAHLAPLLVLLPFNRHWRSAAGLSGLLLAALLAVVLCAIWPLWLARHVADLYTLWLEQGLASLRYQGDGWRYLPDLVEQLSWFAWPALPLALWSLWRNRRQLAQPAIFLPLMGSLISFTVLLWFSERRMLSALPLLTPLILQAASSAHLLRRGVANAFDWFGMMTFSLLAGLLWLGGVAMTTGWPPRIAHNFAKLAPGFVVGFAPLAYVLAAVLTLAWLWLIFASPRSAWRGVSHWAAGVTLLWTLLAILWLPWIDHGKSYRQVAVDLQRALPAGTRCVAGRDLGSTQQVSLAYFAGIETLMASTTAGGGCPLLLVQEGEREGRVPPGWRKVWEGHRPGDRSERLRLYQRSGR
ncbi:MAG: hypothetical protein KBD39_00900 [Sterolibacterium sp.]|nr:hypothetical protein [Sterolibacterium sp.]MBP9798666.1 hypothetical protein [Sterolibacterium sp.]